MSHWWASLIAFKRRCRPIHPANCRDDRHQSDLRVILALDPGSARTPR